MHIEVQNIRDALRLHCIIKSNIKRRQKHKALSFKRANWKLSMMHLIYGRKKFVRKINGKCFYEITFALKMIDLSSNINHLNKKKLLTLLTTRISPFKVCREFVLAKSSKKRFWCNAKYCCMSYPKSKLSVI